MCLNEHKLKKKTFEEQYDIKRCLILAQVMNKEALWNESLTRIDYTTTT